MRVAVVLVLALAGCAALRQPDASDPQAYCTTKNGMQMGVEGRAYYGGCPKESEGAFIAGLERGRAIGWNPWVWSYDEQLRQTEGQLITAATDAERAQLRARLYELEFWAIRIRRRGR